MDRKIGLIGLGNMGRNMALNLDDKGQRLHVYNRTSSKTDKLIKERPSISGYYSIKELIDSLEGDDKIIILMLTTGAAIDAVLEEIKQYISDEDIVIDAGNSYFKDTIRRCNKYSFNYVGAGISGGEVGARYGASIMVGCNLDVWRKVAPILSNLSITSQYTNKRCCEWFGENGAGHFVKMVHNGIEYCDMAIISESYGIFKHLEYDNEVISSVFQKWNCGNLQSYLVEIAYKILNHQEDGNYMIDKIKDSAKQKGTGKDCVVESVHLSSPAVSIMEATFSRVISSRSEVRKELSTVLKMPKFILEIKESDIQQAMYLCRAISFVQGFNLLHEACEEYNWPKVLSQVSDVWTDGCILRGSFLKVMKTICEETEKDFETSKTFQEIFNENIEGLTRVVIYCAGHGIPIPVISSCYNYILGMKTENTTGNMIQAMRDCFGGHTVEFKDNNEIAHIEWLE
ncbi:6-phosphogluconate dehydrogenase, decarboxylating [Nosema granulosis]|uniref:6-phosphogluconate dehydrogenase, decarboxylating n=1 Tax=Nosema granulosis TaxID=83296 RepID=A0A9P6KXL5_9MICR|nr:6-phosphogluconate dehydrogenase, decarboxylating [Nosema granulosis]